LSKNLLPKTELKDWLHRKSLSSKDKLLLVLSTYDTPCQINDMVMRGKEAGFKKPSNPSVILSRSKGLAIHTTQGWEITDAGRSHLRNLGVNKISPAAIQVATDLCIELANIKNDDTRSFVEESIKCYEFELYRSAIVMSWLAAVHVLHREVHAHHLNAFNAEAQRIDSKWKMAKTTDDIGRMKEGDFLDRIATLSIIGPNIKKELRECLDRRNGCGHPNSMKIGPNTVAHHLEILLLNVFKKF
jgi:hypothetical protein